IPEVPDAWLRPFSAVALAAGAALALRGAALAFAYIRTPAAALGPPYRAMTLTQGGPFAPPLALGALDHRALPRAPSARPPRLLRRLEVEAGLAIVTLSLAASIGSAPPAADVQEERATPAEIRSIFTPRWPRLQAPSLTELASATALGDPSAPHSAEET